MARFVHLHVHTEYSLVDGVVRIESEHRDDGTLLREGLIDATARLGMPAVALTDQANLFALVKFYKTAQSKGIKPLIGVDALVREDGDKAEPSRLVLLCQDARGYNNLTRLVTRSYLEGQGTHGPTILRSWLDRETTTGLVALSGARAGDVGRALVGGREAEARATLEAWLALFGNRYYLELQRTGRPGEEDCIAGSLQLAVALGVPVVATNDVRFVRPDDFEAHEARVCIHDGTLLADAARPRRYSEEQYLRSPEQMAQVFADIPEALENSVEIARRLNLEIKLGKPSLPAYPVPPGQTTEEHLREQARTGLERRWPVLARAPGRPIAREDYDLRLGIELDVICQMGFAGYFLIVADFIRWARENGVPVGPGRGSGAGSIVAYALGITDLDPLLYDLLFERFLNPERVSMPDFDVDFCMEGRDRVIDYVAQRYGRDRVSQIITYGTMAAKAVVRDVARVQGLSYGFADSIAKLIPFELGITLDDALEKEEELRKRYRNEEDVREVIDMARSLEGLVRNAGMHAGGVVIAPSVLTDFAPLYCDQNGTAVVTQFDKDDVEAAGLVKFDFLGLRTLTIIDWAVRTINTERAQTGEPPLDMATLPMDDTATYALLKRCETTAVFQLESRGMKDLIKRLQPDNFEDIVALVALFRPGPLQSGMVDDFIDRKHGRIGGGIDYLHPDLKPALYPTYGVILYQEQVMQIAQVLAGYTLGGADLLRRAMGKKKPEEMAKQRSIFVEGATRRGVAEHTAAHIFDLMEKFAGYGFNKSHSAAYAVLSYQTAWLKAHYPAAFMAAVLSSDMDKTDKVVTLIDECNRMGLTVEPPDINASQYMFTVSGPRSIRYGLGAIKGVGHAAVENMIDERTGHGPFRDLRDLCRRLDLNRVNRRVLEALIRAGACDSLGGMRQRSTLMHQLPAAMQAADQSTRAREAGQTDLFGLAEPGSTSPASAGEVGRRPGEGLAAGEDHETLPEWSEAVRLAGERETLGLYLTGHPIAEYERELKPIISGRIVDVGGAKPVGAGEDRGNTWRGPGRSVTVAGLVLEIRKRGGRTSFILDDRSGRLEVAMFEDVFQQFRALVTKDAILVVEGGLRWDDFIDDWRLQAKKIMDVDQAREQYARNLVLRWPAGRNRNGDASKLIAAIESALKPSKGGRCNVAVRYASGDAAAILQFGEQWKVRPSRELIERLGTLVGREGVELYYAVRDT
ncbi:MAG TPA: DNA polymerase III subunit alpha [Steroidobacteraceae bacterium]|nr:DNA polymerase III subunit alpha [Steroidobacteraceae bacterium]